VLFNPVQPLYNKPMFRESSPVNLSPSAAMRQNAPKAANLSALRFLAPRLEAYAPTLIGGLISVTLASAAVLAIGQVFRHLVDFGLGARDTSALHGGLILMIFLVLTLAGASFARLTLLTGAAERLIADLREEVLNHILKLDMEWFSHQKTGDLVSRLSGDIAVLQILIGTSMPVALRNILMVTGGLAMMMMSSLRLSLVVLGAIPVLLGVVFVLGPRLKSLGKHVQEQSGAIAALMAESLGAIRDLQAFARESLWQRKFAAANISAIRATKSYITRRALLSSAMIAAIFSAICGLVWFGGLQVISGRITAGELSAFVFYALLVAASVGALSEILGDLQRASGALERIHEILNVTPRITSRENARNASIPVEISLRNVTFAYPSRPDSAALDNINLTIKSGETLAVVGPSGGGKTTLFNLLLRFYDPQKGGIVIDGSDIREFDLASYRRLFALVPQDPVLFSASVAENIAFGEDNIPQSKIAQAANDAGASSFIESLPDKYQTILGERGARLSGGQMQRLALARALLKESRILLLDEATAHLDSETESAIRNMLVQSRAGRTTLIIAHRLSTVQHADRIIVMDHGKIAAIGTHQELLNSSELYQRLTRTQLQAA
jgi:ATP-binding cassette subfamily B protein